MAPSCGSIPCWTITATPSAISARPPSLAGTANWPPGDSWATKATSSYLKSPRWRSYDCSTPGWSSATWRVQRVFAAEGVYLGKLGGYVNDMGANSTRAEDHL